jgi:hypothetical protein
MISQLYHCAINAGGWAEDNFWSFDAEIFEDDFL